MSQQNRTPNRNIDFKLSDLAFGYTENILTAHGNKVSRAQAVELDKVLTSAAAIISLQNGKRLASPLPCGAGKTTAIRGLIKAVCTLQRPYRIAICAEKVEALCELMRDLVDNDNVPRNKISLIHGYAYDPDFDLECPKPDTASEKADEWKGEHKQFTLLTHSKLRHGSGSLEYDLLIYDETLLLGEATAIALADLAGEIGKFVDKVGALNRHATDDQRALLPWLQSAKQELIRPRPDDGDYLLDLTPLPIEINKARAADKPVHGKDKMLRNFMGMVYDEAEIRVLDDCNQGQALVSYRQTIPDDLNNMLILDASYNIRKLTTYDSTVKVITPFSNIKDHSEVSMYVHKATAGRGHIIGGLQRGAGLPLFDEVSALVAGKLKEGKKVLIFTFKDDGKARAIATLKQGIEDELGMPPALLSNRGSVSFLTWGYETSINSYSDCDTVVFAGLLTLPTAVVAGRVFAQSTDIHRRLTPDEINEVVHSEKTHSIYQALSRGSCRIMQDGKANKMDAYIFSHDHLALKTSLKAVMPGLHFKPYKSTYLKEGTTKIEKCREKIFEYLEKYKGNTLSKVALFNACVPEFKTDTRGKALKNLLEDVLSFSWVANGRSIERLT